MNDDHTSDNTKTGSAAGGFAYGLTFGAIACVLTGVFVSQCSTRPVAYSETAPQTTPAFEFSKNDALALSLKSYSWSGLAAEFQIRSEALRNLRYARIACRLTMPDKTVQNIELATEDRRTGDVSLDSMNSGSLSGEPQLVVCRVDSVQ